MLKNKQSVASSMYIFLVCIYSMMSILNSTYIDELIPSYGIIYGFCQNIFIIAFTLIAVLNIKLTKKKFIIAYCLLVLALLILFENTDKSLLLLITMLIALPNDINLSKLASSIIFTNICTIASIILLCKLGIIRDYTFIQRDALRHGLGFVSANALSNLVTATIIMYIFHKKEKIKVYNIILCIITLLVISNVTNSRMALLLGCISLGISFTLIKLCNNTCKITNCIYFIAKYIFGALFIMSIIVTIYISSIPYNNTLLKINELSTGRLNQTIEFYNRYGIHAIGKPILTVGIKKAALSKVKWLGLDTSYLNYTLRYGVLFMVVLSLMHVKIGSIFKKRKLAFEAIYVIIICFMGITENILLLPYYNFSLFLIAKNLKCEEEGGM